MTVRFCLIGTGRAGLVHARNLKSRAMGARLTALCDSDPETLRKVYVEDTSRRYPVRLFVRGDTYRFWGLFETDIHLFGVGEGGTLYLPPQTERGLVEARIFPDWR